MNDRNPDISVVVPVCNEAGNVARLGREIHRAMRKIARPFEVIFVNDGSTDQTLAELLDLLPQLHGLRVIDLDGNFGEAAALCAGMRAARGALVVTLDGDGQNDPGDIPRLLAQLDGDPRLQAVSGRREQRQEDFWLRVLPSRLANRLIAAVTGTPLHDHGCGLKAYRRAVVQRAQLPRGFNRFLPTIFGLETHAVAEISVKDRCRQHGRSHYGIGRTFVVLRDVLALPFILRSRRPFEIVWAALTLVSVAGSVSMQASYDRAAAALGAMVAGAVWWGLRRYNHAQRRGVFRIRHEYSIAVSSQAA